MTDNKASGELADVLYGNADQISLDGCTALGLRELELSVTEAVESDGMETLRVLILYIANLAPRSFDKLLFLDITKTCAQNMGFAAVRINGECSPGSPGAKMFLRIKATLDTIGEKVSLIQDNNAAQLYWLLSNG